MIYFIVNELSGNGNGKNVKEQIKNYLKNKDVAYEMHVTEYHEHAIKLASELSQKEDCEALVAVGGDGTFSEVLNGIDISVPMGVIPSGSGNDFLRTAGQKTMEERLDGILAKETKDVDFISLGKHRCLNVLGTGFDVDILNRNEKYRKRLHGSASYFAALIVSLFNMKFRKIKMTIDGKKERIEEILIVALANGKFFGGGLEISPDSVLDDGELELVLIKKLPFTKVPGVLKKFLNGKIQEAKDYVEVLKCKDFSFELLDSEYVQQDGEIHKTNKLSCSVKHHELKMFI